MTEKTEMMHNESVEQPVEAVPVKKRGRSKKQQPINDNGISGNNPELGHLDDRALDAFMDAWDNVVLPNPPELNDGYHYFWASTQNKWDSIESRMRGGYELVKPEHIPNFASYHFQTRMHSGHFGSENVISCNEMILMRCPLALFERRMAKYHHQEPYNYQRSIVDSMREIPDRMELKGAKTYMEEGMLELEAEAKRINTKPEFFVNEYNRRKI